MRRATGADLAALAENVTVGFATYLEWAPAGWEPPAVDAASLERLAARLERPDVWCLLALVGGQPAGHVAISPVTTEDPGPLAPSEIFLWQLFVRPPWHGSGIATALLRRATAQAARRGFAGMRLWTPRGAARARRFYEREGWTATGRAHAVSPSGLPTVEYERRLPAG